ncbi:hypothetical protein GCM10027084_23970 [Pseudoxanthomonas sangjuensis]
MGGGVSGAWFQHWPSIGLEREPPGHEWSIAATCQEDVLEAYIMSWPFGPLVDPERWRGRAAWNYQERLRVTVEAMN